MSVLPFSRKRKALLKQLQSDGDMVDCPACVRNGKKVGFRRCYWCGGTGQLFISKAIEFKLQQ